MNDNPYAAPAESTFAATPDDNSEDARPLAVGHLTFILVCGVLTTAISLLGIAVLICQGISEGHWVGNRPLWQSPGFPYFVRSMLNLGGPAIAFGYGAWELWRYRKATQMKNAGTIGWSTFTRRHNRFCAVVTIAILVLFAFRVLNSLYVGFFF